MTNRLVVFVQLIINEYKQHVCCHSGWEDHAMLLLDTWDVEACHYHAAVLPAIGSHSGIQVVGQERKQDRD